MCSHNHVSRLLIRSSLLLAIGLPMRSPAQSTPAVLPFGTVRDATQLDGKDAQPFHLRMDVQLYDVRGNPEQPGTIEEWWVSPNEYRIEINSGPIHEVRATGKTNAITPPDRESYLLEQLLTATVSPLGTFGFKGASTEFRQTFGNVELDCFRPSELAGFGMPQGSLPTYCLDPNTPNLRAVANGLQMLTRNSIETFHQISVAHSVNISYLEHTAISGKITVLEPFAPPNAPGVPSLQPQAAPAHALAGPIGIGDIRPGHILNATQPTYPAIARAAHIGGTVLLHALITKDGKVDSLFVIASPSDLLTQPAMDAVRTWQYEPYLVNGQPTEVDTTVTVNFNLTQ